MVVNSEFQRKEERYYRFDEVFYYILNKEYIDNFYQDERLDDFVIDEMQEITYLLFNTTQHTSSRELAAKIRFIDCIRDITPEIYRLFADDNKYTKYSLKMCRFKNEYLLNWRLKEAGVIEDDLTEQQIHNIAVEGFTYAKRI